jgi:hypothetical protein
MAIATDLTQTRLGRGKPVPRVATNSKQTLYPGQRLTFRTASKNKKVGTRKIRNLVTTSSKSMPDGLEQPGVPKTKVNYAVGGVAPHLLALKCQLAAS